MLNPVLGVRFCACLSGSLVVTLRDSKPHCALQHVFSTHARRDLSCLLAVLPGSPGEKSQGRDAPRFMHHHAQPSRACLSERLQLAFRLHHAEDMLRAHRRCWLGGFRCFLVVVLGAGPRFPRPSALRSSKIAWGRRGGRHIAMQRARSCGNQYTQHQTHTHTSFQMCSLHFACSSWYVYVVAASLRLVPY